MQSGKLDQFRFVIHTNCIPIKTTFLGTIWDVVGARASPSGYIREEGWEGRREEGEARVQKHSKGAKEGEGGALHASVYTHTV
jgi:hypothetical protein